MLFDVGGSYFCYAANHFTSNSNGLATDINSNFILAGQTLRVNSNLRSFFHCAERFGLGSKCFYDLTQVMSRFVENVINFVRLATRGRSPT